VQRQGVKNLLKTQKTWVEAYAESRADYFLATRSCPVVLSSSSYLARTMKNFPFVGSLLPKEGTFITIENVAIPISSDKEKLVYAFLNFLYRPDTASSHYNTFGFFPATTNAVKLIDIDFEKLHFIKPLLPEQEMRDLWVEVKSSG
jgi:spermidine/putrescine transport system substrate-binding protein